LTQIVILTRQMRQIKDPEFAALLKRIRVGKCTNSDFELLNRLIPTNGKELPFVGINGK
jgi:hypothetical protein